MARPLPVDVGRVAVVGTGLIGARWAAFFLSRGLDVAATDPAPGAEQRLRRDVAAVWPLLERVGLASAASTSRLSFSADLARALAAAEFVQENVPDDDELKTAAVSEIDGLADPEVIIASSTSGILPTVFQARCRHPERVLVGHPFNPAHLVPLVEVVAGEKTCAEAVDWAIAFYSALGKRPLRVRKEAPGFVSNRMQEAIWREMFHLVNDGIATTGELDRAITDGPGLRWAIYGPAFIYFLQGGRGGMAYALSQFDPARIPDWSHNYYPQVTDQLARLLDDQTRDQAKGRSLEEWERLRDEFLVRVLEVKREVFGE